MSNDAKKALRIIAIGGCFFVGGLFAIWLMMVNDQPTITPSTMTTEQMQAEEQRSQQEKIAQEERIQQEKELEHERWRNSVEQYYWYCWNTGYPSPHHLGYPVDNDHYCTNGELDDSGFLE